MNRTLSFPLAILTLLLLLAPARAQSVQILTGSGCGPAPAVSGPWTVGSYIQFDDLGDCTPYMQACAAIGCQRWAWLVLGLPQPAPAWIPVGFRDPSGQPLLCSWALSPSFVAIPAAVVGSYQPIRLTIPPSPWLVGARVGFQAYATYLLSDPFLGSFSPALELTIG